MKAEELRIGNYILVSGREVPVASLDRVLINGYGPEIFTGIPLSPEWLERTGFKRSQIYEQVDGWYKKPLAIQTDQEIFMVTRIGIDDLELKYIHQLQNLYFALTGTELTINF